VISSSKSSPGVFYIVSQTNQPILQGGSESVKKRNRFSERNRIRALGEIPTILFDDLY
jgi:hypothetical protein